jgi:acetyltransferase-like isoleucine patch superfamily enzyme
VTGERAKRIEGDWYDGEVPANVCIGEGAHVETTFSFSCFRSRREPGLTLGRGSAVYTQTLFDVGEQGRVTIGDFTLVNGGLICSDRRVEIGSYALLSWGIVIMDSYRVPREAGARREVLRSVAGASMGRSVFVDHDARPVVIGDNVWIGFDACILPGVTIGRGSVVGAKSVVAQDVEPYTVVAGSPAAVVKELRAESAGGMAHVQ